jgi:hypothetical protein
MKEYTESDLQKLYDKFMALVEKTFTGERLDKLRKLYSEEAYGVRLVMAPASAKAHFHNAYVGGYIDHIMNVYKAAVGTKKLWEAMGATIDFTDEEMIFSALHHDLGKLGDLEQGEYYLPQTSDWHQKNRGELYKFNANLQYMDVTDRALYILQQHQIVCSWKETLAIKLSDGLYHDACSSYLKSYNPDNELKTNLPRVVHAADYLACRSEYDGWKREQKSF